MTGEAVPLARAAAAMGVTYEALRMRLRRGTIKGFRGDDGRLYVQMPAPTDAAPAPREQPVADRSSTEITPPSASRLAPDEEELVGQLAERLMNTLEREVADLRRRLDEADRAQGELRRLLLMAQQSIEDLSRKVTDGRARPDGARDHHAPREARGSEPFAALPPWAMLWLWPWMGLGGRS